MSLGALVVLSVGMLGVPDVVANPRSEYEAMASQVGRDPDAHAKLALWCEAHGLDAERAKHLGMAVLTDPKHALARSLMGLVQEGGKWRRPELIVERNTEDPARVALLEEYHARRSIVDNTADAQAKLGAWCESKGLTLESQAHYAMALRLDPNRADIWKRLGYSKHKGEWRTDAMIAAEKAEAKAQEEADRHWGKQLQTWKEMLGQAEGRRREAEAGLLALDDPRAVGAVLKVFAKDNPALAVRLLGQIDAAAASRALAMAAVFAKSAEVRRAAAETLTQRDPREYVGYLIGLLQNPVRYEVRPVGGPGSPGELWVEGEKVDLKRVYLTPPPPQAALMPGDWISYDPYGLPVIHRMWKQQSEEEVLSLSSSLLPRLNVMNPTLPGRVAAVPGAAPMAEALERYAPRSNSSPPSDFLATLDGASLWTESIPNRGVGVRTNGVRTFHLQIPIGQAVVEAQRAAARAQGQLQEDVAAIERYNAPMQAMNERVLPLLERVAGREVGQRRDAWESWWIDQIGYAARTVDRYKPTFVQGVPVAYSPPSPVLNSSFTPTPAPFRLRGGISCFAAGTLVWTQEGFRPIETLEVGDMVLSQDATTGTQSYQPVLVVHRNPPSKTLRVKFEDGEPVLASTYHRFWKANHGWVMARELKLGDVLRTQSGVARVSGIEEGDAQPVFNLDVAHSHSFFVGTQGMFVHDNSLPDTRLTPFDRLPELAQSAP